MKLKNVMILLLLASALWTAECIGQCVNFSPHGEGFVIYKDGSGEILILTSLQNYPVGYQCQYYVDWGDGVKSEWVEPDRGIVMDIPGPLLLCFYHVWLVPGVYVVKIKARDPLTLIESAWSLPIKVTIGSNLLANLESPVIGPVSGIQTIYGWALYPEGISKVELYIDNQYVADIPYGGTRRDVSVVYPGYPDGDNSGFAMVWNWAILTSGEHMVTVRPYGKDGYFINLNALVSVRKFGNAEMVDLYEPGVPSFDKSICVWDGIACTYAGRYRIVLGWDYALQSFKIVDIQEVATPGIW